MKLLSIDTSTKILSLAISQGTKILNYRNIKLNKVLSSSIVPMIKQVLQKSRTSITDLDGFAVGLGPGSFTSLRVGLSTIKGLAFATGKPVVGISSLDILAMNVVQAYDQICTICDAKRNLLYACFYQKKNSQLKRKSKYLLVPLQDVLSRIKGEVIFIGDGVETYEREIEKLNREKQFTFKFAEKKLWYPQAAHLALLALERFKQRKYDHINTMVPIYLYPKDCQVRK